MLRMHARRSPLGETLSAIDCIAAADCTDCIDVDCYTARVVADTLAALDRGHEAAALRARYGIET